MEPVGQGSRTEQEGSSKRALHSSSGCSVARGVFSWLVECLFLSAESLIRRRCVADETSRAGEIHTSCFVVACRVSSVGQSCTHSRARLRASMVFFFLDGHGMEQVRMMSGLEGDLDGRRASGCHDGDLVGPLVAFALTAALCGQGCYCF